MRRLLVVVDMQNDFIDGALGTKEAVGIVPDVIKKIASYSRADVYATRDTHPENYLETQEGRYLPVKHCVKGTEGWKIQKDIAALINEDHVFDKPTFGSVKLAEEMSRLAEQDELEIELAGLSGRSFLYTACPQSVKMILPQQLIDFNDSAGTAV